MNRLVNIIYSFFIFLLSSMTVSFAQTPILRGLTVGDDLFGSIVYNIYKDNKGFVWIASDKGVNRFDGYHVYPCKGINAMVNVLTQTPDGTIMAGNEEGLWKYDVNNDCFSPAFRSQVSGGVTSLITDSAGMVFAGTSKGLFVGGGNRWKHILIDRNVFSSKNHILSLAQGDEHTIWVAGEKGLYTVDWHTGRVKEILKGESQSFNTLTCLEGNVYIGTRNAGILKYNIFTGTVSSFASLIGSFSVKVLSGDASKHLLYAGTDGGGVFFISTITGQVVKSMQSEAGIENTLRSNSVYSLLMDRDGILWIGYFQMGLDYTLYQNNLFSLYNFPPAFSSYHIPVRAIAIHDRQRVIGSRDGLFFIDERRNFVKHYTTPLLGSNMVFCILYYKNSYLIGTAAGLYQLNPENGELHLYNLPGTKNKDELFFSLTQGRDGSLWVGTTTGVFRYKDGRSLSHFEMTNSQLPDGIIYNIYEDSENRIWIATRNGICLYEPSTKSIHTDLFPKSFPWRTIRSVYESASGYFYFVTKEGRILMSSPDFKSTAYFLPQLFSDGKKCVFLTEDSHQGVWVGTDNGLYCRTKKGHIYTYTFRDGIPNPIFFGCTPVKDQNGDIWFGNSQGLLIWRNKYNAQRILYSIQVTDVSVNNQSLGNEAFDDKGIRLSSSKDELTFHISDMSYTNPSSVIYEYRLEGQDNGWKQLKGRSDITYYNLSSGFYTLRIRLAGVPTSEVEIPVSVGVSWWLIILVVCIFIGVLVRILIFRSKDLNSWKQRFLYRHVKNVVKEEGKYRNNKVEEESCAFLKQELEQLMQEKKMYLQPDLKLKDLAGQLGVPIYNLSYVLNIYMHQRFNDYVNNYRVLEFKTIVKEAKYRLYTLDALSSLCGFSSKTSFFRNFKRVEGITPSEYIRQIQ